MKKIMLAFLAYFLILCWAGAGYAADLTYVANESELAAALGNLPLSNDIRLSASFFLSSVYDISKDVTISGDSRKLTSSGGGFTVTSNKLTLNSVYFDWNSGSYPFVDVSSGGSLTVNSCNFDNNQNGALRISGTAEFSGTHNFNENSAANGGAISITGGTVALGGTFNFKENKATSNGGGLYLASGTVTFNGTYNFTDNSAVNGGGFYTNVQVALGSNFNFKDNQATGSGGGAYLAVANSTINGAKFEGNKAANGGGIYALNALTVAGDSFTKNIASANGGAIYSPKNVNISGGAFSGNEATDDGGAVYSSENVNISGGSFSVNKAGSGGAVYSGAATEVNPSASTSITFDNNSATVNGGAIFTKNNLTAENVIFIRNSARSSGGATYSDDGKSTFKNCLFGGSEDNANHAGTVDPGHGGAVLSRTIDAQNCTFGYNYAKYGGGIFLHKGNASDTSTIANCWFYRNSTLEGDGGAFSHNDNQRTAFTTTVFESNNAARGGGAAYIYKDASTEFIRCTFSNNKAGSASSPAGTGNGGAVSVEGKLFYFLNCTFTGNSSTSRGGALYFSSASGGSTSPSSAVYYCTITDNSVAGQGQGGGIYSTSVKFALGASAIVGNYAAYGKDVSFESSAARNITSLGYNIIGNYGTTGDGGSSTNVDWTRDPNVTGDTHRDKNGDQYTRYLIFGTNTLGDNLEVPITVGFSGSGMSTTLKSLATVPTTQSAINPVLDVIPDGLELYHRSYAGFSPMPPHTDQRGRTRPMPGDGYCDIGAYESGAGGPTDPPGPTNTIAYIRMSGIPNDMTRIGHTCSLTAIVYYVNGSSGLEAVTWESSNPYVADVDQYGNLVSLAMGSTTITVKSQRLDQNNELAEDSAELTVTEEWAHTNVHPDVWRLLGTFNAGMRAHDEQLYFMDSDPADAKTSSFEGAFREVWGVSATQMTNFQSVSDVKFDTKSSYAANNWASAKPSISVSIATGAASGALVPFEFAYGITWDEVSKVMGRTVTKIDDITELFGYYKLLFESVDGVMMPVVDADGEYGIAASKALSSGALSITNGNNGLSMTLKIYLANVKPAADGKPRLIDGRLIVSDRVEDGVASGSLWLLKRIGVSAGGGGSGSGEGSGGCNAMAERAWFAVLIFIFLIVLNKCKKT